MSAALPVRPLTGNTAGLSEACPFRHSLHRHASEQSSAQASIEVYADSLHTHQELLRVQMAVAQPALEPLEPPFGAVVARQLSVWPFAARTQRLFLLVDPSLPEASLRHGLLRAMQQAYFRSDTSSQTRSVRETALAAHYVLRHRN